MRHGPIIHRYLDPGDALGEVMFGIIMTLSFTVGARFFLADDTFDRTELIVGAVGCNVAWGIIDGVLFIVGSVFFRSQRARFYRTLRGTPDNEKARAAVADHFGLEDEPLAIPAEERNRLYEAILAVGRSTDPAPVRVKGGDLTAAFLIFMLVTFAAIPCVIPLLLIDDEILALRVSNAVQVVLLFVGGYRWGAYTDLSPWKVGLSIAVLGFGMCVLAVLLGG
jgi:hypothetical protein